MARQPVLNVAVAMEAAGASYQAAEAALERPERRGVVTSARRRSREWAAMELIGLMTAVEGSYRRS